MGTSSEHPEKTIKSLSDWSDVLPVYNDYTGDTQARNHPGAESKPATTYTNFIGRNDFHLLKVARDQVNIFFYAETTEAITENLGSNWMRLYLDMDRNANTGWLGYDYRVVGGNKLQKYVNGKWDDFQITDFVVDGNKLMITIPLIYFGIENNKLDFEFKWSDNMQYNDDPLDWYVYGDVAPGGRFNYIYKVSYLTTGIETEPGSAVMVSPNPSSTYFQVQTRNPSDKIILYDMLGNIVDQQPRKVSNCKSNIGSNLHPGIYLLVVTEQNGAKQTIKLIKN